MDPDQNEGFFGPDLGLSFLKVTDKQNEWSSCLNFSILRLTIPRKSASNTEFWNNPKNLASLLYMLYTALPTVEPVYSEHFKDQSIPEQTDGWITILGKCMGNY